ncbi:hypothetical protein DICSQDRAFT_61794, partial [Dichomitus squalens LYAD-421 SS1]
LYLVSRDVLAAQASGVVCERVFSSSKETDTLRRSRLHPVLMEALQILKFRYRQERLDLFGDIVTRVEELTLDDLDTDVET